MIKTNDLMSILVLSCDKYRDLWDDFFTLLEKYWPDCNFKKYLATDTVEYTRPGVHVIHFGHEKNWTKCARIAVEQIDTPFISLFLEDAFICREINNRIINEDVSFANVNQVDFLTLERKPAFLKEAQWSYYAENIVITQTHFKLPCITISHF